MISIRLDGDKKTKNKLNAVISGLSKTVMETLDKVAYDTQAHMKSEAPYHTGALARSITVTSLSTFSRMIEPKATNFGPNKNKYANPIESGWGTIGAFPNVTSISLYYGVDMKMAFAIAAGIASKTYPANPFVKRTYEWLKSKLDDYSSQCATKITAIYKSS